MLDPEMSRDSARRPAFLHGGRLPIVKKHTRQPEPLGTVKRNTRRRIESSAEQDERRRRSPPSLARGRYARTCARAAHTCGEGSELTFNISAGGWGNKKRLRDSLTRNPWPVDTTSSGYRLCKARQRRRSILWAQLGRDLQPGECRKNSRTRFRFPMLFRMLLIFESKVPPTTDGLKNGPGKPHHNSASVCAAH